MYRFALLVVAVTLLTSSVAQAASYRKKDRTVVDPILNTSGSTHDYSGNNLEADTNLAYANLSYANLSKAWLAYADLSNANLSYADLPNATLTNANLTGATLTDANLYGADLHEALLPSVMPTLPVIDGAVVQVVDTLAVPGSVQVDTGGNLSVSSNSFTAGALNM